MDLYPDNGENPMKFREDMGEKSKVVPLAEERQKRSLQNQKNVPETSPAEGTEGVKVIDFIKAVDEKKLRERAWTLIDQQEPSLDLLNAVYQRIREIAEALEGQKKYSDPAMLSESERELFRLRGELEIKKMREFQRGLNRYRIDIFTYNGCMTSLARLLIQPRTAAGVQNRINEICKKLENLVPDTAFTLLYSKAEREKWEKEQREKESSG
jgi:hypothetical protein